MAKTIEINGHTFEVLRAGTVSGGIKAHQYNLARKRSLGECYNKCSSEKWDAFFRCKSLYEDLQGKNYRIATHNYHTFTFAFELPNGAIVYITKAHDYIIL